MIIELTLMLFFQNLAVVTNQIWSQTVICYLCVLIRLSFASPYFILSELNKLKFCY
jgi:hypothetical protein